MEWVDRKITPIQNSALYPVAQIPAKVTFPALGRGGWGVAARLIVPSVGPLAFSLDQIDHCFLKSAIACSRVAEYPRL
jgi:hypothetical protein